MTLTTSRNAIAGLILAGGRSTRFDGGEKEKALLNGRPLIEHVIERAAPQVRTLAVSRPRGEAGRSFGFEIVADDLDDRGPIAGLAAGLRWALALAPSAEFLATFACDTPHFPEDLIHRLAEPIASGAARASIASAGGALHPTFGLWPVDFAGAVERSIEEGALSLKGFARAVGAVVVEFDDPEGTSFFNINRREDLRRLEKRSDG